MLHLLTRRTAATQPRVTPDNAQADALRRKLAALDYRPTEGFHKDRTQGRIDRSPATRWQKIA